VFDKEVADGETSPLRLRCEPLGQFGRQDNRATDAIVALPDLVGCLRQALSSRPRCGTTAPRAGHSDAECGHSGDRDSSDSESLAPAPGRPPPEGVAAGPAPTERCSGGPSPMTESATSPHRSNTAPAGASSSRSLALGPSNSSNQ